MMSEQEYCGVCQRATFLEDGEFGCQLPSGAYAFVCHDCIDGIAPPEDGQPQEEPDADQE